jgi:hypothetical protein
LTDTAYPENHGQFFQRYIFHRFHVPTNRSAINTDYKARS